jgi:hypothetical protein
LALAQVVVAMPSSSDFKVESLQASVFLPAGNKFSSSKVVGAMLKHFAHLFDGEMQVLPVSDDIPASIPRVILASANNQRKFTASTNRVDFIESAAADMKVSVVELTNLVATYVKEMEVVPERLGFVANRSCSESDPAHALISAFCNDSSQRPEGPFSRSSTFEIHNHKEYRPPLLDYEVNSWVRCSCRKRSNNENAIVVAQDINTLKHASHAFDEQKINQFFDAAHQAANEILSRYFPNRP